MRVVSSCGIINVLHYDSCHQSMTGVKKKKKKKEPVLDAKITRLYFFQINHLACCTYPGMKLVRQEQSHTVALMRVSDKIGMYNRSPHL